MRVPQRGRAILRRLSPHTPAPAFRPGDFLLTRSDAGLARILGWACASELNHAALIVDPLGSVVEATPTFFGHSRAFRLATISDYLRAGKPCWIGYVELREGTRQDVIAYAQHLLRNSGPITHTGRVWLALHAAFGVAPRAWTARSPLLLPLHRFFERHAIVLREEHCFSSGELVARALERGGFMWNGDPASVTPADLFARYHHEEAPVHLKGPRVTSIARTAHARHAAPRPSTGATASITPFVPRGTNGATALADAPRDDVESRTGVRALMQVGILMAAGLAVIGVMEELYRLAVPES